MSRAFDSAPVLAGWQTKLLQLDRRNNLLYFKPGRGTVRLVGGSPDELEERLLSARKGLAFAHAERIVKAPEQAEEPAAKESSASEGGESKASSSEPAMEVHVYPGDLHTEEDPLDLEERLKNLSRRDREWQEEQGMNVLFLAVGFLGWVDEDGEEASAPLVLLPCDLRRKSPRDPYHLLREGDERTLNPTLAYKLSSQGVELPEPGDETLAEYLELVRGTIGERAGWFVSADMVLGIFAYSKLAMWQDLERLRVGGLGHPLVLRLAGAEVVDDGEEAPTSLDFPDPAGLAGGGLDEWLEGRERHDVLAADFSQLRAIEAARSGQHLVIHGPPGTGKSQTIANIIANLLADGRRVLFVSEKTAALDVVKRRLEACGLGTFCLDLHSERGKKNSFYRQLSSALEVGQQKQPAQADFPFERWSYLRDALNGVVRALHEVRDPLGLSVYQVHGRFAELAALPRVDWNVEEAPAWTRRQVEELGELAERVARRASAYEQHATSPWKAMRDISGGFQLTDEVREDMRRALAGMETFDGFLSEQVELLALPEPASYAEAETLGAYYDHWSALHDLPGGPKLPRAWLEGGALERLEELQREAQAAALRVQEIEADLAERFVEPEQLDFPALQEDLALQGVEREHLLPLFGAKLEVALAQGPARLGAGLSQVFREACELQRAVQRLGEHLDSESIPEDWRALGTWVEDLEHGLELQGVPAGWLQKQAVEDLQHQLTGEAKRHEEWSELERRLGETFSDGVLDVVDHEMRVRYRTDHQSFLARFKGSYKQDDRALRGYLKQPRKLSVGAALELIELALEAGEARREREAREEDLRTTWGARYRGLDTQWETVRRDLERTWSVVRDWSGNSSDLEAVLQAPSRELRSLVRETRQAYHAMNQAREGLGEHLALAPEQSLEDLVTQLELCAPVMDRLAEASQPLEGAWNREPESYTELQEALTEGARWRTLRAGQQQREPELQEAFLERYPGLDGDWSLLEAPLSWLRRLLEWSSSGGRDDWQGKLANPPSLAELNQARASFENALAGYADTWRGLEGRFDFSRTPLGSWQEATREELRSWARALHEQAGEAGDWLEYRGCVEELEAVVGEGAVDRLREASERATDVPGMVLRRFYLGWLEAWMEKDARLAFSPKDHEEQRREFARLDAEVPIAHRLHIRRRCLEPYPDPASTGLRAGQLGVLLGELSKRRRQLPVRRVLPRIDNLLRTLKPCFLMSPLAVSQYLPRGDEENESAVAFEQASFDTVIFDEASQVFPEEAIPAIVRARQVIVVGDQQQLPPTDFFRSQASEEPEFEVGEGPEDRFEGRESILDVLVGMAGQGVASEFLRVHYRSRHEDLIRYSNRYFYDDRLFTFPGPARSVPLLGVSSVYLADGRFDAGGSRTNRREAEEIVEQVFTLLRGTPVNESVGVVTLSRPQADLIDQLITERRRKERDLDERFAVDVEERFFVKNLENVQGDERDHILISVGYGPSDESGKVANRFGPINQPGGERRLNVAVSRARRSMIVVHSMRPEDITAEGQGARMLRAFLGFVRDPRGMQTATSGVEIEAGLQAARFEQEVQRVLEERGHSIDRRIGACGYFVDLGIRSEDDTRYDLGIEFDGPGYHATPSARDRDVLRPSVLRALGWQLVRVWSTAWIRDPEGELQRIEAALAVARGVAQPEGSEVLLGEAEEPEAPESLGETAEESPLEENDEDEAEPSEPESGEDKLRIFEPYREHPLEPGSGDLMEAEADAWAAWVQGIVETEAPVHRDLVLERLRGTFDNPRLTPALKQRFEETVQGAVRAGKLIYESHAETDDEPNSILNASERRVYRPRTPEAGAAVRNIRLVPAKELEEALLLVIGALFGALPAEAVSETARQLGYGRAGKSIAARLEAALSRLLEQGRLEQGAGGLHVGQPPESE